MLTGTRSRRGSGGECGGVGGEVSSAMIRKRARPLPAVPTCGQAAPKAALVSLSLAETRTDDNRFRTGCGSGASGRHDAVFRLGEGTATTCTGQARRGPQWGSTQAAQKRPDYHRREHRHPPDERCAPARSLLRTLLEQPHASIDLVEPPFDLAQAFVEEPARYGAIQL